MSRLLSFVLSIIALLVVGFLWYQSEKYQAVENADPNAHTCASKKHCIEIPTGLYIQSMHFLDSNDVNINGYLWQKYPHAQALDSTKAGVIFPEEVYSADSLFTEAYRVRGNDYTLIGWYFDVTLRQRFDYARYPLDTQRVWLRLWPRDIDNIEHILLVPDRASYSAPNNTAWARKFGLDPEIVPGGWRIDQSYFDYKAVDYGTNFGFANEKTALSVTELQFNIAVTRNFRNAFVINLVPLFVVALLLFAQVALNTDDKSKTERFGLSVANTIATGSALFFVVILAHIQVRNQFAGSDIVYIEYFYLIMYVFIFLVVLNAYAFASGQPVWLNWLTARNNEMVKVAYWPALLWLFALATAFVFAF